MIRLAVALSLLVSACASEANEPAPTPTRPAATSTTTTILGVVCDINGAQVNTGSEEAASAHLRCAP